jgi:hypothetical protein
MDEVKFTTGIHSNQRLKNSLAFGIANNASTWYIPDDRMLNSSTLSLEGT